MEQLSALVVVGWIVACGIGLGIGWFTHRLGEQRRQGDHDADHRESIRAAGVARDRAREEAREVEARFQRFRQDHEQCEATILELRTALTRTEAELGKQATSMSGASSELDKARAQISRLQQERQQVEQNSHKREQQAAARIARLDQDLAQRSTELQRLREQSAQEHEAHGRCAVETQRLEHRIAELEQALVDQRTAMSDGAPDWLLQRPRDDRKDDLTRIRGLGPVLERGLNELGIYHYDQLLRLTPPHIDWLAARINVFPGKIRKEDWAGQARRLQGSRGLD